MMRCPNIIALQSSYYLVTSSVVDINNRVKTIEKVSRREFPYGFGEDSGGGNTVKLLESTVARFGPIASFRGTYRSNHWTLPISQMNQAYPPGKNVCMCFESISAVCACACAYVYILESQQRGVAYATNIQKLQHYLLHLV